MLRVVSGLLYYLVCQLLDSALILADSLDCIYTSPLFSLNLSLQLTHLGGEQELMVNPSLPC